MVLRENLLCFVWQRLCRNRWQRFSTKPLPTILQKQQIFRAPSLPHCRWSTTVPQVDQVISSHFSDCNPDARNAFCRDVQVGCGPPHSWLDASRSGARWTEFGFLCPQATDVLQRFRPGSTSLARFVPLHENSVRKTNKPAQPPSSSIPPDPLAVLGAAPDPLAA